MIRSNSKRAIDNIQKYIIAGFSCENYEVENIPTTFPEIARFILDRCNDEKFYATSCARDRVPTIAVFEDWCQGLPSSLDTCYYYNRSAVSDLGEILEETQEETDRYDESRAAKMLTSLIYRELVKAAART